MTTLATVRSSWVSKVWTNATVRALTGQIHNFDTTDDFEKQVKNYYYSQQINSIFWKVYRGQELLLGNQVRYTFPVTITYYREVDPSNDNYNSLLDAFDTIDSIIVSQLGSRWNATVDFYTPQSGPVSIRQQIIDGRTSWVGEYTYTGTVTQSLS